MLFVIGSSREVSLPGVVEFEMWSDSCFKEWFLIRAVMFVLEAALFSRVHCPVCIGLLKSYSSTVL